MKSTEKLEVGKLIPGMFVSQLDRPWLGTPFLIEGLLIESEQDIEELARHCRHVFVDYDRSTEAIRKTPRTTEAAARPSAESESGEDFRGPNQYADTRSIAQERAVAARTIETVATVLDELRAGIEKGLKLSAEPVLHAIDAMRESVIRNPDAMLLMSQLRDQGGRSYDMAVSAAAHLLALGRHLGLPRQALSVLGMGGLLMNVGYLRMPSPLRDRAVACSPAERRMLKNHAAFGYEILRATREMPEKAALMALQHHEREDGSGYPQGLHANQIDPYGKMAAVINAYVKQLGQSQDTPRRRPSEAMSELRRLARQGLNAALVEQFAQCIGLFPAGSLVELTSGEVGIVLTHSRTQRYRPQLMLILGPDKRAYEPPRLLDLRQAREPSDTQSREIARDLAPGSYGIDPARYFLEEPS
ncbi:MAG: DUF3391 domain-containing protein [Rhodocyclaceae bacterium]|jgi:HD-GYP domain-containing protein (c-di-GMP phosphodiesterase class II)|nr:DUF3391 domain-containing protein [Rhodocyclaceae bacterium]